MSANKRLVDWTPELIERVRVWWEEDRLSATEIASMIGGGATKNTVIGKAHRCGWQHHRAKSGWFNGKRVRKAGTHPRNVDRPRAERPARPPRSVTRAAKPKPAPPVPPAPVARPAPLPVVVTGPVRFLDLVPGQCKWPVNDPPRFGEFLFCGEPQFAERVYCEKHCRIAYTGTKRQKAVSGWTPRPQEFR